MFGKKPTFERPTSKNAKNNAVPINLVFQCQLAHGSPIALITGFVNVRELYARIAKEFDLKPSQILYCTLNTHKVNMSKILTTQLGYEDLIFAHQKGTPKEIELIKESDSLGITIVDNGAGMAIVKRKRENTQAAKIEPIEIGDHIEKINGTSMIGKKHHEVAQFLRDIPIGATFTLRLIEPLRSAYSQIEPRRSRPSSKDFGKGNKTVRFKSNGSIEIEEENHKMAIAVEKINTVLENYYGVNDSALATQIWELSEGMKNSIEFQEAINMSDLDNFFLTEDLLIEIWGAVTDARRAQRVSLY